MKEIVSSLLLVFTMLVCNAQNQECSFSEKYKIDSPAKLSVGLEDGDISVYSSNENTIKVNYIVKRDNEILNIDKEELLKHFDIDIKSTENSLKILSKPNKKEASKKWHDRMIVSYEITVPQKTSSYLYTVDGDVFTKGLHGIQKCKSSDGDIRLENIKGKVSAISSDGDISLLEIEGDSESKSSDGDIRLSNLKGDAIATTSDGHIKFSNINGALTATTSDGDLNGNILELRDNLSLTSSDGDIRVTIPNGLGIDLVLRGEEIDVKLKNFDGTIDDEYIQGKLNGGGIPVSISTSDGDLTLRFE